MHFTTCRIFYKANCVSKDKTTNTVLNTALVRRHIKMCFQDDRVKVEIVVLKNNHMKHDDMSKERSRTFPFIKGNDV